MKKIFIYIVLLLALNASAQGLLTNIYAAYNFEGNSNDVSGGGNNGTDNGSPTYSASYGKINKGIYYANTSSAAQYTSLPTTINTPLSFGSGNFSTSCWIYAIGYNTALNGTVFGACNAAGTNISSSFSLGFNGAGVMTFFVSVGSSNIYTVTASISLNVWYHIVCIRNGTSISIFVNGLLIATTTNAGITTMNATANMSLGRVGAFSTSGGWNGYIDAVCFWKTALTAKQVANLYNSNYGLQWDFRQQGNWFMTQ